MHILCSPFLLAPRILSFFQGDADISWLIPFWVAKEDEDKDRVEESSASWAIQRLLLFH